MKTERRHELESNKLAQELNVWGERLRPYHSAILMGLAAVVGCYAVLSMWNARTETREQAAWEQYQQALLSGDREFRNVRHVADIEEFGGSRMQEWAYITWADRQLRLVADDYLTDRDAAKKRLSDVAAIYEQFAANAAEPDVRSRAQLGQARVSELESKLDLAKKQYGEVVGVMAPIAEARLKELESTPNIGETVTWLATVELPKPAAPSGGGGLPGMRPDFGATPPPVEGTGVGPGSANPFDPSRSIQDILGGLGAGEPAGGRYGAGAEGTPEGTAPATTEGAAPGTTVEPATGPASPPADNPGAATGTGPAEGAVIEPDAGAAPATPPATPPASK